MTGSACYFYRDIGCGSYGGDVNCLQQFLKRKGHLKHEPTGYFGTQTESALAAWQKSQSIKPANGVLGLLSRQRYARKQRLPVPGKDDSGSGKKVCIDVCSEFNGVQDCETRCVR